MLPHTSSPSLNLVIFDPTLLTIPDTSLPRIQGNNLFLCFSKIVFPYPSLFIRSIGLTELDLTLIRTSFALTLGVLSSLLASNTEASPYLLIGIPNIIFCYKFE